MRLRRPCKHGKYDDHYVGKLIYGISDETCPGGEFLPEDALLVERDADGKWPEWAQRAVSMFLETDEEGSYTGARTPSPRTLDRLADALAADQVGEPG